MAKTWGKIFAAIYDPIFRLADAAGLAEERRAAVAGARGEVLEIGAGTGRNLDFYGPGVTRLVLTEPEGPMAKRLRARVGKARVPVEVFEVGAEALPFEDGRFDTVVSTLVLCTVPDVPAALAEIRRVLAPGGSLLFVEHVRGEGRRAEWQDRLHDPWFAFGNGCHCNRDTVAAVASAGFEVDVRNRGSLKFLGPLVSPLVRGSASVATDQMSRSSDRRSTS